MSVCDSTEGKLPFTKYHTAGASFIVMDGRHSLPFDFSAFVTAACNPRFGIGADGMIVLDVSKTSDCRLRYFNANGSVQDRTEAIRCLARYVYTLNIIPFESRSFVVETEFGRYFTEVIGKGDMVRLKLGQPVFSGSLLPNMSADKECQVILNLDGKHKRICPVVFSDVYCVEFVSGIEYIDIVAIGNALNSHSFFPNGTNVVLAEIIDQSLVKVRCWQRVSGVQLSNDDANCAVVAAGVKTGRLARSAEIETQAGVFEVDWSKENDCIYLTGPVDEVFTGELAIAQVLKSAGRTALS